MLLQSLMRLSDARQERLAAADTTVPAVVWIVTLMGGALTVAFASLLGVPSLGMHLAMSAAMAISGALVLIMIIALCNPFRGDFRVSTDPFDRSWRRFRRRTEIPPSVPVSHIARYRRLKTVRTGRRKSA
jgi:hypothetical protein